MAERKPLGLYEGAPGQFRPGDFLPISVGGTGADTAEGVRDALSIRRFLKEELIYVISSTGETGTLPIEPDIPVFRTIEEAMETIAFLDFNGFSLTLVFLEGEYEGNIAPYAVTNAVINLATFSDNAGQVVINGDGKGTLQAENGVKIIANRLTINNLWNSSLYAKGSGQIEAFDVYFGPGGSFVARVEKGGKILIGGEMQLTGGRSAFVYAEAGDVTVRCRPLILVDSPVFDESFLYATDVSKISFAGEIVGLGQGRRYDISKNCIVMLPDGAGEDYFPLTIPGKNDGTCFYGRPISNRRQLLADTVFYVRTDGNDSNNGFSNSMGGAFKTIQKAVDVASNLDNGSFDVTIMVFAGTYTEPVTLKSIVGNGRIIIRGFSENMVSTIVNIANNAAFDMGAGITGTYYFQYMRLLRSGTAGAMIQGNGGGGNILWDNINFTASAGGSHIQVGAGQTAVAMGNYTITGGGLTHLHAMDGGHIRVQDKTITITGTPGLTNGVATATRNGSIVLTGNVWSGATSGARYNASMCGTVFTGTAKPTTLPGSANGVRVTGGQYA